MKCPHCTVEINPDFEQFYLGEDVEGHFSIAFMTCPSPSCKKLILELRKGEPSFSISMHLTGVHNVIESSFVRPLRVNRPPVPKEVQELFAEDYNEACLVLPFSTKASAALSRRCLQNILREKAGVKKGDLSNEIQEVIDSGKLPTHLSESIDAIRHIGNFAAINGK
ncbi:MAG: DUF4145 domain-containing protein [Bacteroidales bacterium]|nr:DUF4145 domain-containing protein [Bacteroidales bacterium]